MIFGRMVLQQNPMEQMTAVVQQSNDMMVQTVNAQFTKVNATNTNMNVEGTK